MGAASFLFHPLTVSSHAAARLYAPSRTPPSLRRSPAVTLPPGRDVLLLRSSSSCGGGGGATAAPLLRRSGPHYRMMTSRPSVEEGAALDAGGQVCAAMGVGDRTWCARSRVRAAVASVRAGRQRAAGGGGQPTRTAHMVQESRGACATSSGVTHTAPVGSLFTAPLSPLPLGRDESEGGESVSVSVSVASCTPSLRGRAAVRPARGREEREGRATRTRSPAAPVIAAPLQQRQRQHQQNDHAQQNSKTHNGEAHAAAGAPVRDGVGESGEESDGNSAGRGRGNRCLAMRTSRLGCGLMPNEAPMAAFPEESEWESVAPSMASAD